ncbi:hypothetical protein pclt_cds_740 [Pandoravirus celtis]|uniref:F-box incomplete domain containing protein n=1 Tax=Pandoravirus celtis TaxID=2568002 RepID=A0A4D6EHP5_9VIRU|nr:hypothetical protein pclt_cds_740 [Pandoravirus celtis]
MDTLPAEIGCMILGYLDPIWLVSASMASHGIHQWSVLVCRGEAPRMPRNAMEVAAAGGAWDFMQWIRHHLYWPWTPVTLATAAVYNQRFVFKRLLKGRTCSVDARAAAAALVGGGPALLGMALQHGCPKSGLLTTVACLLGRDGLASRLMRTTVPDDLMNLCGVATHNWQILSFMTPWTGAVRASGCRIPIVRPSICAWPRTNLPSTAAPSWGWRKSWHSARLPDVPHRRRHHDCRSEQVIPTGCTIALT